MATEAIYIHPKSPIQAYSTTIYTNSESGSTELIMYDNTYDLLDFTFIRKEGTRYKLVFVGKANGFYDSDYGYLYRFNFNKFIKYDKVNTDIVHVNSYYAYMLGNNECDLTLCMGDIFATSNYMFDYYPNGEIWLKTSYTPTDVIATKFRYVFKDKVDGYGYYKPTEALPNTWYPITVYYGTLNFSLIDTDNNILYGTGFSVPAGYSYIVGFIKIPNNFRSIQFAYDAVGLPEIYNAKRCANPIYFMDKYGTFDVMYCNGVSNTKNVVERENIKIGKNIIVTKQETQKQIIQNTGLGINSNQLYNLLSSPLVYKIENNKLQEYELETSEFGGYNGVTFGNRNIELVLNLPYKQERITNKRITFFD